MSGDETKSVDGRPDFRRVTLNIAKTGDKLKFIWWTPLSDSDERKKWRRYLLPEEHIIAASKSVREALQTYATSVVDDVGEAVQLDNLKALARAGEELFEAILPYNEKSPDACVRRWLEKNVFRLDEPRSADDVSLEILVDFPNCDHIPPLGLAFTPRSKRPDPKVPSFENFEDFWSISLRSACWAEMQNQPHLQFDRPVQGKNFDLVIMRESTDKYYKRLETIILNRIHTEDEPESAYTGAEAPFMELHAQDARSIHDSLTDALIQKAVLIHFDLDAHDPESKSPALRLPVDPDRRVEKFLPEDLGDLILKAQDTAEFSKAENAVAYGTSSVEHPTYALAVVDREALIRGDRGNDWLMHFFTSPWIGLIAVEADIRTSDATKWEEADLIRPDRFLGLAFLIAILDHSGRRLVESIKDARRDCWPYSLFFGIYCNPQQPWIEGTVDLIDYLTVVTPHLGPHHPASDELDRNPKRNRQVRRK